MAKPEPAPRNPAAALILALLLAAIGVYRRWLSPWLPPRCRFHPSCSVYASEALTRFGPWRGSWLAVRRILRCHPLNPGGPDPVPDR